MHLKYVLVPLIITFIPQIHTMKRHKKNPLTYLQSQPFQGRLTLAAQWIKDCNLVIEIGGAGNPISNFVKDKEIIVIDPAISTRAEPHATHIKKAFEQWEIPSDVFLKKYAVVILGLALDKMPEPGWKKLYNLIDTSQQTVVEYSTTYKPAKNQIKWIKKNIAKKVDQEIELDLSKCDFSQYSQVHPYRKMICFK